MNFQDYVQCANLLYTGICTQKKKKGKHCCKARKCVWVKNNVLCKLNHGKDCYVETKYRIMGKKIL